MTDPFPTEPCRTCQAPIVWAETQMGRSMPVDAQPSDGGNVMLVPRDGRAPTVTIVAKKALRWAALPLHTSHFATCVDADRWRKR